MSARGVVVAMILAMVAGLALIFVAWPSYMTPVSPWDVVSSMVLAATHGARRPLVVLGFAGMVAAAILVATFWMSRRVASDRPG